jgi:hypothetical protein
MKVIIAGSRSINDPKTVAEAVKESGFEITEVVSGACKKGVDALGEKWAFLNGILVKRMPADWDNKTLGKLAGMVRNKEMAEYAEAAICIWDGKSHGTLNMIQEARLVGIKVYVKRVDEEIVL